MANLAILESWTEYERGWGRRPDGYTLHINKAALKRFCEARFIRNEQICARLEISPSDEYSAPGGNPKVVMVTDEVYERLQVEIGIWVNKADKERLGIRELVVNPDAKPTRFPWDPAKEGA